ncbi:MAG: serine hydrolase [Bacteroidales bacterium]|jgi:CubicO group peptidase (beta-lactamase class C family)|nr:serine hydrolase [Bacteroidales bacterium]MDD2265101.1 serine hydrolase [Bacteroidales bacterium]MDD2832269.1 serine hydrolase [Bacteroidales bacterium]MDD3209514.1 serine hydrolase [Bacteroidales bacterium]MDD3698060.1 serine hydrolase [Bacteroidales bacterium]
MKIRIFVLLIGVWAVAACTQTTTNMAIPVASPKAVGMDPERLALVDGVIQEAIQVEDIPGAVLAVVRHDRIAYLKAYGNRQLVPDTLPMTVETVFDLASVSKCVGTTLSIMQLVERGRLRLMDRVDQYLPGFQSWTDPETGNNVPITIEDLMTHTSGLPPYGPTQELIERYGSPNPGGLMEYICQCPRDFKPKTGYQYSCLNFITLQNILEKITGVTLAEYAQKNVFDQLGLQHTTYMPQGETLALCAPTELQEDGLPLVGNVHDPLARLLNGGNSGNAGVFSNAKDLAVIAVALLNGGEVNGKRILGLLTVKAMARVPENVTAFGRTLGWAREGSWNGNLFNPGTVYGHTGYTGTSMVIDPESDTAVIILANRVHPYDDGSAVAMRTRIANIVAGAIIE